MDKKIKTLIAEKKLSDEDILKFLEAGLETVDNQSTEEEVDDVDAESHIEEETGETVEEDATEEEEQPDMKEMIKSMIAEALTDMKGGKAKPKPKKVVKKVKQVDITREFGAL